MKVLEGDPLGWRPLDGRSAVAIGVFDGVHLGHREILEKVVAVGHRQSHQAVALTFDPHPLELVAPEKAPVFLTSVSQRLGHFEGIGIDVTGILAFGEIRDLAPETFVEEILVERVRAARVSVGVDWRFGRDRAGDVSLLERMGEKHDFSVQPVELVCELEGEVVSSTRIRRALGDGDVKMATRLLGHPFIIEGHVIHGDSRGRELGVPTVNLHVPERIAVPGHGIYASVTHHRGERFPSVTSVGVRPTFDSDSHRTIETHILDFDEELYGEAIGVEFIDWIRPELKFDSVGELIDAMEADIDKAREILS